MSRQHLGARRQLPDRMAPTLLREEHTNGSIPIGIIIVMVFMVIRLNSNKRPCKEMILETQLMGTFCSGVVLGLEA